MARKKIRLNTPEEEEAIIKAALSDPDNPPITEEEAKKFRPASEVIPQIVEAYKRSRGRPKGSDKTRVNIHLDNDVIELFKGDNPKGWQSRVNQALRESTGLK